MSGIVKVDDGEITGPLSASIADESESLVVTEVEHNFINTEGISETLINNGFDPIPPEAEAQLRGRVFRSGSGDWIKVDNETTYWNVGETIRRK